MTNDELLEKLGKIMDAKLDEKLEPITKRFETVEQNMATKGDLKHMATTTDIHDITEDMARFFHKTWEKMDETNERVTIIEEQLNIPNPKENKSHFQKELVRFLSSYGAHFFSLLKNSCPLCFFLFTLYKRLFLTGCFRLHRSKTKMMLAQPSQIGVIPEKLRMIR